MKSVQLEVPNDIYLRLINHPDCPAYKGRRKWILQILIDFTNSATFKQRPLEEEIRRVRRESELHATSAVFWKNRAGGLPSLFAKKPDTAPTTPPVPDKTNAA